MAADLDLAPIADDYGPHALEVWHEHRRLDRYPADWSTALDGNTLWVLDSEGTRVKTYAAGQWSGAGHQVVCAYLGDRPDCPRCHPKGATAAAHLSA